MFECLLLSSYIISVVLQAPDEYKEFSIWLTGVADTSGIIVAGVSAIFVHNYVHLWTCRQYPITSLSFIVNKL